MIQHISHYRVEGELGRGGMGIVYRAVDTRLGRPVAIKMLPPGAIADPARHQRFVQEARSASALNHPNIVTIYEIGEDAGATFIAMELIDGTPLDKLLAQGPLPVEQALDFAAQIAGALAAAHALGIVHRDIKPANIVITPDARAKVLDFGLAKLVERAAAESTITAMATMPGTIVGTLAYMSPEQAEARPVDARSDIFSLGAVLYEMLAGRRPFVGTSDVGLITAILRDPPAPVRTVRPEVPAHVDRILERALAKDPAARYPDAASARADLVAAHARLTRPLEAGWRRPAILVPVALLLIVAAALGVWQTVNARRARWAREIAIPEIERLQLTEQSLQAVTLAREAERYAPAEVARVRDAWWPIDILTDPEGAEVALRNYLDDTGSWELLGVTPLLGHRFPAGEYRLRITKAGYEPLELGTMPERTVRLMPKGSGEPGMVLVGGGRFSIGVVTPVELADYWIDMFEVTNREFKRFVDAGGYGDQKYWKEPLLENGRTLGFDAAMARFRDSTGRTGPSTWELGSYPEGQEEFPVGGISWFEAAAYAEFAGKSLPTLHHWLHASGVSGIFSDVLRLSNFDAKGPRRTGERASVGPWGTYDMAGNVKEWCRNEAGDTGRRYILGGGWMEPAYRFREPEASNPWRREPMFGVRLMKTSAAEPAAYGPVTHVYGDPDSLVPVSDEQFELIRGFYKYDPLPVDGRLEEPVEDASPHWRKETVSFTGPTGSDRVLAVLFLPKNAAPPYQTVVLFPSSYAREIPSSKALDMGSFEFIVRSGRAVLYPVYEGTYERRRALPPGSMSAIRDRNIMWAKEFFRAVDYVETRPDLDKTKLGYYSLSLGAFFGPIPIALEPRIKVAVFAAGGLRFHAWPEFQTANFMPRVKTPVLLINGRDDFSATEADLRRFLHLLGTPAPHKKLVRMAGGHIPSDMHGFFREVLDWYETYLGPAR